MDTKVLKGFGIFLLIFVLIVVGLVVYDNMTRVEVLKQDHVSDVTFVEDKKNKVCIVIENKIKSAIYTV